MGILILFVLALILILSAIALVSDIGFSDEIKQYRAKILCYSIWAAVLYVIFWSFIDIVNQNISFKSQAKKLQNRLDEQENVLQQKGEENVHLRETVQTLIKEITNVQSLEVIKVQYFKNEFYLTLKRENGKDLVLGDEIHLLDQSDGDVYGAFQISQILQTEYLAKGLRISPIWLGYFRQMNQMESSAPPNTLAVHFPKELIGYDE